MKPITNPGTLLRLGVGCILLIGHFSACGKIINGYDRDLALLNQCVENLQHIIAKNQALPDDLLRVKRKLFELKKLNIQLTRYHRLTGSVIVRLKEIDLELYQDINTIRDKKGNLTDVFVKVVPINNRTPACGFTTMNRYGDDGHEISSPFGIHSVYVQISSPNVFLLAHEFGHIKYQVPHFADYLKFYNQHYVHDDPQAVAIGHASNDPSGQTASSVVKNFVNLYRNRKSSRARPSVLATIR